MKKVAMWMMIRLKWTNTSIKFLSDLYYYLEHRSENCRNSFQHRWLPVWNFLQNPAIPWTVCKKTSSFNPYFSDKFYLKSSSFTWLTEWVICRCEFNYMLKMVLDSNISSLICSLVGVRKDIRSSKTRSNAHGWTPCELIMFGSPFVVQVF